jgi:hypothetical protein
VVLVVERQALERQALEQQPQGKDLTEEALLLVLLVAVVAQAKLVALVVLLVELVVMVHQTQSAEPQPHTQAVEAVDLTEDHIQPLVRVVLVKVVTLAP